MTLGVLAGPTWASEKTACTALKPDLASFPTAMVKADNSMSVRMCPCIDQPTTLRENKSITTATCKQPSHVRT